MFVFLLRWLTILYVNSGSTHKKEHKLLIIVVLGHEERLTHKSIKVAKWSADQH